MIHAHRPARRLGHLRAAALCATALCMGCVPKLAFEAMKLEGRKAAPDTITFIQPILDTLHMKAIQPDTLPLQAVPEGEALFTKSSDRFEARVGGYTYTTSVDYPRLAQQAARSFGDYVRCGTDRSRRLFLTSLDLLVDGKNHLKQEVNLGYLLRDPVYSEIRTEFRTAKPDDGAEDFLDAIGAVKAGEGSDSLRAAYGNGFVDAVLKYSK